MKLERAVIALLVTSSSALVACSSAPREIPVDRSASSVEGERTPPPSSAPRAPTPAPAAPDASPAPSSAEGRSACGAPGCRPGAVRYCDNDSEDWSLQQTCSDAGTWSECLTSSKTPAGAGPIKDQASCIAKKLCCQEDEGAPFEDYGTGACAEQLCTP